MRPEAPWALAIALLAGPAAAQAVSEAPERAAVTIYRSPGGDLGEQVDYRSSYVRGSGLAFISETRTLDLPAGRQRISFRGVADTMVPETAALEGLPGALIERNEDYNLLSAGSLLEASIGKSVRLVRTNPKTGAVTERTAIVRAGPDFPVLEVDGGVEGLRCSGAPERLVFDEVPATLSDKPTFSVLADVPTAGRYTVRLSYLATGFDWSAAYVAKVAADGRTLDLTGWLTLANRTSASFANAPTDVVAGELSRDAETRPPEVEVKSVSIRCWPVERTFEAPLLAFAPAPPPPPAAIGRAASVEEIVVTAQKLAVQSDLGDYKLYTLPEPTTVAARQTKQVLFLDQQRVPFERIYGYRMDLDAYDPADLEPQAPEVILRLKNDKAAGLGKPLPSGVVSVMEPSAGAPVLAGEDEVRDTAVGLPLEVELGRAMDVAVTVRVLEEATGGRGARLRLEAAFANDKPQPIVLEYRQARRGRDFKVADASIRHGSKLGEPMWTIRLKPGERTTLTYAITYSN